MVYVYVDEGGNAALSANESYFVMAAAAFATEEQSTAMRDAIRQLRDGWGKLEDDEFKFAKLNRRERERYFECVGDREFKHCSCVLTKTGLEGGWTDKYYVYEKVARGVVDGLRPWLQGIDESQPNPLRIRVFMDEHTDKKYVRLVETAFRAVHAKNGASVVEKFTPMRSHACRLVQLADFLCGAARWDSADYQRYVARHCLRRHLLPEN